MAVSGSEDRSELDIDEFIKRHVRLRLIKQDKRINYTIEELRELIRMALAMMKKEPMLATLSPPCVIVGDIHGQYFDLIRLFNTFDDDKKKGYCKKKFIFLGDYVDRGLRALECVSLILSLKLRFPKQFVMLRGNHEVRNINRVYGFYDEIMDRFDDQEAAEQIWDGFNEIFTYLPVAGLVAKRILCMHGGLSPHLNSLDDIRKLQRPIEDPGDIPLACDLLWSDPKAKIMGFQENTARGVSLYFGEDVVIETCNRLNIDLVIRAHQVMLNGYGFFANRRLITVFTAPRYQPELNNRGAVVIVDEKGQLAFKLMTPSAPPPGDPELIDEDLTIRAPPPPPKNKASSKRKVPPT